MTLKRRTLSRSVSRISACDAERRVSGRSILIFLPFSLRKSMKLTAFLSLIGSTVKEPSSVRWTEWAFVKGRGRPNLSMGMLSKNLSKRLLLQYLFMMMFNGCRACCCFSKWATSSLRAFRMIPTLRSSVPHKSRGTNISNDPGRPASVGGWKV